jgi:hypothetical protein
MRSSLPRIRTDIPDFFALCVPALGAQVAECPQPVVTGAIAERLRATIQVGRRVVYDATQRFANASREPKALTARRAA